MIGDVSNLPPDINPLIEKSKSQNLSQSEKITLGQGLLFKENIDSYNELFFSSKISEEDRNKFFEMVADRHITQLKPDSSSTVSKVNSVMTKVFGNAEEKRQQFTKGILGSFIQEGKYRLGREYQLTNQEGSESESLTFKQLTGENAGKSHVGVYQVQDTTGQGIAFYKEGIGRIMEGLIPSLADILGYGDLFTTTVLFEEPQIEKGKEGGLQPALTGGDLRDPPEGKPTRSQLTQATLASLVFGMWDAHEKNIRFDNDGNLKFFDNARSLPHSNESIMWAATPRLPYASALLGLQGSYADLTKEELKEIRRSIGTNLENFSQMEKFLNDPSVKNKLNQLPPRWLNVEEALSSMKERLENMQKALSSEKVSNLRDLVFAAFPQLKFMAALQVIHTFKDLLGDNEEDIQNLQNGPINIPKKTNPPSETTDNKSTVGEIKKEEKKKQENPVIGPKLDPDPKSHFDDIIMVSRIDEHVRNNVKTIIQRNALGEMGNVTIDTLIKSCINMFLDPAEVKAWSESQSFEDLIITISKAIDRATDIDPSSEEAAKIRNENLKNGEILLKEIKIRAKADSKDIPLAVMENVFDQFNSALSDAKINIYPDLPTAIQQAPLHSLSVIKDSSQTKTLPTCQLFIRDEKGEYQTKKLDYLFEPGKVVVEGSGQGPQSFKEVFKIK